MIFVKGNSINILYGDYASAYQTSISLPSKNFPNKIALGDFNKDGKVDIAYVNYEESTLSVFFAKSDYEYFPEIVYLKSEHVQDLIPYYSKFINGLALLCSNGKIVTLTNLSSISNNSNIAAGAEPSSIKYFDLENNGIIDIAYLDKYTNNLNLIIRNNAGIPSNMYMYQMHENHNEILIDNSQRLEKIFYCYSHGKKLIEVFDINFSNKKINRTDIYSPGNILDLKFKRENENINLYVVYKKDGKLGAALFENKNSTFYLNDYPGILNNVASANISINNQPSIYAWSREEDSLKISLIKFGSRSKNYKKLYSVYDKNFKIVNTFLEDLFNKNKDVLLSFFKLGDQKNTIANTVDFSTSYKNIKTANLFSGGNAKYFYGEMKFNGLKKLFFYNPDNETIFKIDFINNGKNIVITKIADEINLESFFIKNMNSKNYHIVFINNLNHSISIKKL